MYFHICCTLLLLLRVAMPCQGFDFTMDRREYLIKNQTYCGLLQCQADTVSDPTMASLIKMDIYYLKNEQLLTSMLAVNSDIQTHTGNNTIVIGSMTKDHGELHMYFSDVRNCSETSFMCKIQFKNYSHEKEFVEKIILPKNSDQNEAEFYVKSQISIEHKIFEKTGAILKRLKPNSRLLNEGTGFYYSFGRPALINSDDISNERNKIAPIPWRNATNDFEQKLFDFEVKIRRQLEVFMNQMSTKIEDMKFITKDIESKLKEVTQQEIIRKSEQSTSTLIQSHIEPKLSTLEKRMDDIIEKIDHVNVSLNWRELKTHTSGFEIIQKLDSLLDDNKLIGFKVSTLENNVTEILKNDRQMYETMKEILTNDRKMNDTMKETLNNERLMNDTMKEILNNDAQIKYSIKEVLNNDRQMNDAMKEIIKNNRQMNDTMKEILSNVRQMNDTMKEILNNDRQIIDTIKEIQHDVNNINTLLKEEGKMGEIQQSLTLLHNKLNDSKLLNVEITMGKVVREMEYNTLTMNDLKQSVNDKCNHDVLRNKTDQGLSSLVEHLEELKMNQGSIETLLVNVSRRFNKFYISQLKCERGISSEFGSRVITTLDNRKQVLCDTETDGGGWIIIQRRVRGDVNFTRNWNDYKYGFGSLDGDFWIGNELISSITRKEIYTLRIDMRQGSKAYRAEYDSFMVKNESDNYRLHLGVFSGNISDSLMYHNNMAFSTSDRDNDNNSARHCAQYHKSGWWYNSCRYSHLNGVWGWDTESCLWWWDNSGNKCLDFVEMKLRLK